MDLSSPTVVAFEGVFGVLLFATVVVFAMVKRRPERNHTELQLRIRSWWVILVLFATAILASKTTTIVLFAFVSFLSLKEYLTLIPTRRVDRRTLFWGYLTIPLQYFFILRGWYGMSLVFIPVYLPIALGPRMIASGETKGYIKAISTIYFGTLLTVFGLSHLAMFTVIPQIGATSGISIIMYVVTLTQFNDVAQYVWGKNFGRTKITPTVSPNKTWEGFLGGFATTVVISILVGPWMTPLSPLLSACSGAFIGVAGFFGDLNMSALKRDLGVKDTGALLPGHGGILDRVDSLTYTAPVVFHFIYFVLRQGGVCC